MTESNEQTSHCIPSAAPVSAEEYAEKLRLWVAGIAWKSAVDLAYVGLRNIHPDGVLVAIDGEKYEIHVLPLGELGRLRTDADKYGEQILLTREKMGEANELREHLSKLHEGVRRLADFLRSVPCGMRGVDADGGAFDAAIDYIKVVMSDRDRAQKNAAKAWTEATTAGQRAERQDALLAEIDEIAGRQAEACGDENCGDLGHNRLRRIRALIVAGKESKP